MSFHQGYLIFSTVVAMYTYFTISKKKGKICALAISLMYFSYAKLSIATFSYNTIAQAFLLIFLLQINRFLEDDIYKSGLMIGTIISVLAFSFREDTIFNFMTYILNIMKFGGD